MDAGRPRGRRRVGAASRDLVDDDPRGWRLGGGASYAALALGAAGPAVGALIGADARPRRRTSSPAARGRRGRSARARWPRARSSMNVETPTGASSALRRCRTRCRAAGPARGVARGRRWLLAPVAAELPDAWAAVAARRARGRRLAGAAPRAVRREPVDAASPGPSPIVRRADLVGVGRDDVEPGDAARRSWRRTSPGRHDARSPTGRAGGVLVDGRAGRAAAAGARTCETSRSAQSWTRRRRRHVPRRRVRRVGRSVDHGWRAAGRTRTCGSAPRLVADPRGPGLLAVPDLGAPSAAHARRRR